MAVTNITLPQIPTLEDLWEIIQAQKELLSRYHTITQAFLRLGSQVTLID